MRFKFINTFQLSDYLFIPFFLHSIFGNEFIHIYLFTFVSLHTFHFACCQGHSPYTPQVAVTARNTIGTIEPDLPVPAVFRKVFSYSSKLQIDVNSKMMALAVHT